MIPISRAWMAKLASGGVLGFTLLAPLAAQSRLYVLDSDGHYHPVFKVSGGRPYVLEADKPVPMAGDRYLLRKVEEYQPILVSVHDRKSGVFTSQLDKEEGLRLTSEFRFRAEFQSTFPLDDVFLVLEGEFTTSGKLVFTYEIGRLEPYRLKPIEFTVPLDRSPGSGEFNLHVFVGGNEVFTSEIPADAREEALDQMVAKRIADMQQAKPRPFFVVAPEYPPDLRKSGVRGQVVVQLLITPKGAVREAVLQSATAPVFADAALAAVKQWRFLPKVEDGRAVELRVNIPLIFDPPAGDAAQR